MNNGLGINFLRFVCEEDPSSWSQVFARLPFDEVELKQKGALFGVIKSGNVENWADVEVEMTNWVEEYFNGVDKGGNLGNFFTLFSEKYPEINCLWLWLVIENETRKLKIVGSDSGGLVIQRAGTEINLGKNLSSGKVITGELKTGDILWMWEGNLSEDFETWEEQIKNNNLGSYAAFKITVENYSSETEVEVIETVVPKVEVKELESEVENSRVIVIDNQSLASDKYVGPINIFKKITNWFKKERVVKISVDRKLQNRKKWSLGLGLLFLILLVSSLMLGSIRKKGIESQNKWLSFSAPIEKGVDEALGLVKINQNGSKKLVEDARSAFNLNKAMFTSNEQKDLLEKLNKKIDDAWVVVSGEKNGNLTEIVNLSLIRAGVNASRISNLGENKFVVLGTVSGLVMSVDTKTKEVKVLAGKGAGLDWVDAVSDGSKYFVMSKSGIFVAGNESSNMTFDTAVTNPVSLSRFGTALYVLEKGNKEIFKYLISDAGFGERARWLKENQTISDLPLDLDIDVDVWVLEEGGHIERFRRGSKEPLTISGLPEGMIFEKITVEKNGNRIALLSSKSGSVVFCDKTTGVCGEQFKNESLKEARDIEFDTDNKLIVLSAGSIGVLN